jgi:hypothetical protein
MPTPGHTDGHQSLIVRRPDGAVIVAGQSHDTATQYAADQLAWRAHRDAHGQPLPGVPDWMDALQQLDPGRSTSPTTALSGPLDAAERRERGQAARASLPGRSCHVGPVPDPVAPGRRQLPNGPGSRSGSRPAAASSPTDPVPDPVPARPPTLDAVVMTTPEFDAEAFFGDDYLYFFADALAVVC